MNLHHKDESTSSFYNSSNLIFDLLTILLAVIVGFSLIRVFNISNFVLKLLGKSDHNFIIELLLIFFLFIVCLIIFIIRRKRELNTYFDESVHVNEEIQQYEKRFESIIYTVPSIAIYAISKDHTISYWNQTCTKMFGYTNSEAVGKNAGDLLISDKNREDFNFIIDKSYKSNVGVFPGEMEYLHKNRYVLHMLTSFHWHESINGNNELYNLSIDRTELLKTKVDLDKSNKRLHTLARTDPLTQLPNRRAILEKIDYEKLKYERSKQVFTIAMIDLDNFKDINDKYGHECGDFVLKQISNLMIDLVRKQDIVGRYGGEEFILLLPQTNSHGALHVTQLILEQIAKFPITFKDKEISLTVTMGVSDYTDEKTTINDLIKRSDKAMRKGKAQGKNRVVIL